MSRPSQHLAHAHATTVLLMARAISNSGIRLTGIENDDDVKLVPYLIGLFSASEISNCLDEAIKLAGERDELFAAEDYAADMRVSA